MTQQAFLSSGRVLRALSESQIYRDYERAFTEATGFPLRLCGPDLVEVVHNVPEQENPFCMILAEREDTCAKCRALRGRLKDQSIQSPHTLRCFADLCETAIPICISQQVIGFLQTGHVFLKKPTKEKFDELASELIQQGAEVERKRLKEAYFGTRVLPPKRYESVVELLKIFSEHLASCSQSLALHSEEDVASPVVRAKRYIQDHSQEALSLAAVARAVNMSATYFSEKFKEATGIGFVEYVARTRVERARALLQNPKWRIGEIAFEVGFQSLSQFNRVFKKFCGQSPGEFRAAQLVK